VTGTAPDSAQPAAGENAPAASGALDAAATAVATVAPRQAGAIRDNGAVAVPAAPASPAAPAVAAPAVGGDSANGLTQGEADTAFGPSESTPGQNKAQDVTGRTAAPAQLAATGQASEQAGGGTRAGAPEALIAGSEPGPRADAPPTGHSAAQGQTASPPASFANELRLATGAPSAPDAAAGRTPPGPVVDQMAVQISRAVSDGQDKLTIDLRPAVLGRVSVSLEVGHDHRVIAVISADRADTLELLQRDVRTLERALQDAGLKTDSGSLSFSLNGDGAKKSPFSDGTNPEQLVAAQPSDDEADAPPTAHNPYARVLNPAGIDIHV
jgi:flagellar hook-length control protein FliK